MSYRIFLFLLRTASIAVAQTAGTPSGLLGGARFANELLARSRRFALKTRARRRESISRTALVRRQLGSLLEGTGAGCVWFDYNNSGRPSLYVVNGRPLDDSMHPVSAERQAGTAAAQSSLSQ